MNILKTQTEKRKGKPVIITTATGPVTIGAYCRGVKKAKENPDAEYKHGLTCWWPCTGKDIVHQFMDGVHDRINQRGGLR